MPKTETQPLFIHGVQKTGTSTLVGMLNAHPKVFIMYETRMDKSAISKYGNQIIEKIPSTRSFFRNSIDAAKPYLNFSEYLHKEKNINYKYIGDKFISLDATESQIVTPHKVIYTIRDVRTWLCKEQIIKIYRSDVDIVAPAIDFLKYIINSFKAPNSLHIRLEDLVKNNDQVIESISKFLNLDFSNHSKEWWNKVGDYSSNDPKRMIEWSQGHPSSKVKPSKVDTVVSINSNPFWDEYLSLFDKYYNFKEETDFTDCIDEDLEKLDKMIMFSPIPIEKGFKNVNSKSLSSSMNTKSISKKIKTKLIKMLQ